MSAKRLLLAALVPLALGCSGGSGQDLSVGTVTTLPDGNGTGTAASGTYTVMIDVTSCVGECSTTLGALTISLCNVGPAGSATITVTQTNGHLDVHTVSTNVLVQDYSGGIDANGSYDIGGVAMNVDGQPLTVTSRAQGTIVGGNVTGTVDSLGTGTVNGTTFNCVQTIEVSGTRG